MKKSILLLIGAVALPFIIQSLLLLAAEPIYNVMPAWGIVVTMGLTGGFAVGTLCMLALTINPGTRIAITLVYWPLTTTLMFHWTFFFTGHAFGRWL